MVFHKGSSSARPSDRLSGLEHSCDWEGCPHGGEYRAPRHRYRLGSNQQQDYHFFCLEHVREYNRNWDYFAGMDRDAIEHFQREAVHGHRPTWRSEERTAASPLHPEALQEAVHRFFHFDEAPRSRAFEMPVAALRLSDEQRQALALFGLEADSAPEEIKARYKALVKQLHPDVNNGSKESEERFKRVVAAYQCLQPLLQQVSA